MSTPDVAIESLSLGDPRKPKAPQRKALTKPKHPSVGYYKHAFNPGQCEELIWFVLTVLEGWTYIEENGTLIRPDGKEYVVNPEFHVTVLFPRGSEGRAKADTLEPHLGKSVTVRPTEVGVNEDFVCIRVECDAGEIPYYGNEVVHITFAMVKLTSDCKKPQAKDSYKALESGTVFRAEPKTFSATFTAHMN